MEGASGGVRRPGRGRPVRIAVLCGAAMLLLAPALIFGAGESDSSRYNYVWATQFDAALAAGHRYPGWLPLSFAGYGSPAFFFYPPLSFYLIAAARFATFGALPLPYVLGISQIPVLLASGGAMFAWLRPMTSPRAALFGAVAYMAAPYHLTDYYWRGAVAEFAFFAVWPLVVCGVRAAATRWHGVAWLGAGVGLMVTAHLPSALFASMFVLPAYAVFVCWRQPGRVAAGLVRCAAGGLLGLGLAACYLGPALNLQSAISAAQLWRPEYSPARWVVFAPGAWPPQPFIAMIGFFAAGAAVLLAGCVLRRPPAGGRRADMQFWSAIGAFCICLVVAGPPVFWNAMPLMGKLQFPWRLMSFVEFATVTCLAISLPQLGRRRTVVIGFATLMACYPGLIILGSHAAARIVHAHAYWAAFEQAAASSMPDASEYLPAGFPQALIGNAASPQLDLPATALASCTPTPLQCDARQDAAGVLRVTIDAGTATSIRVRRFYFPGWRAVDREGRTFPTHASPPLQTVTFEVPSGQRDVQVYPGAPPGTAVWTAISAMSAGFLLAAVACGNAARYQRAKSHAPLD